MRDLIHCIASSEYFQITGRHKTITLSVNERSDSVSLIQWMFPDYSKIQDNFTEYEWEIWWSVSHQVEVSRSQEDTTIALRVNERSDELYPIKWKFPDHRITWDICLSVIRRSWNIQITQKRVSDHVIVVIMYYYISWRLTLKPIHNTSRHITVLFFFCFVFVCVWRVGGGCWGGGGGGGGVSEKKKLDISCRFSV